jgi:hypothetical protein
MTEVSIRKGRGRPSAASQIQTLNIPGLEEMRADYKETIADIQASIKKKTRCPNCKQEMMMVSPEDKCMLARSKSVMVKNLINYERDAAIVEAQRWNAEQCKRAVQAIILAVYKGLDAVEMKRRLDRGETVVEILDEIKVGVVEDVKSILVNVTEADLVPGD